MKHTSTSSTMVVEHFSIGSIPEMKGHVISCYTFTKTYAMTGWRIGYLHADETLIPQITQGAHPLCYMRPGSISVCSACRPGGSAGLRLRVQGPLSCRS
ncbi:MAG: aminotransferase class I/II-fold pyridoxal phosphate-dependent enzyme [candidate division Zixibacteria bacterium]|nr:aminotransferase class I/II-fold pyridoxal phosphate-dependent enzyme [candidate division Zixibacteria bacterium]